MRVEPITYFRITDAKGRVIEDIKPQAYRVLEETPVRHLNAALQGVITRGTAKRAAIGRPAAGKTGTTNDYRDAWFIGYVPQLVTGIWIGNDNNSVTKRATGGSVCAPVWASFMKTALKDEPAMPFPEPQLADVLPAATESGQPEDAFDADDGLQPRESVRPLDLERFAPEVGPSR